MVGRINTSSPAGSLSNMLKKTQDVQQEILEQSPREVLASVIPQTVPNSFSGSSSMAGNFAKSGSIESHQSSVVLAQKAAKKALSAQSLRQNAILAAGLAELATAQSLAEQIAIGKRAKERILREKHQATIEASERNLDEIKDDIEQKAHEALAPKDAEGNPIETQGNEDTTETAVSHPDFDEPTVSPDLPAADITPPDIPVSDIQVATPAPTAPPIDLIV